MTRVSKLLILVHFLLMTPLGFFTRQTNLQFRLTNLSINYRNETNTITNIVISIAKKLFNILLKNRNCIRFISYLERNLIPIGWLLMKKKSINKFNNCKNNIRKTWLNELTGHKKPFNLIEAN